MRSKVLFFANMIVTLYVICLLLIFLNSTITTGGMDDARFWQSYADIYHFFISSESSSLNGVYVFVSLWILHITTMTTGIVIDWIGYFKINIRMINVSAILYLVGAICFPFCILFALPSALFGFAGSRDQKQINAIIAAELQKSNSV